ncbi:hypothetical protein HOG47_01405 [archaeon]|nr:hypothetical protein [archaeon]
MKNIDIFNDDIISLLNIKKENYSKLTYREILNKLDQKKEDIMGNNTNNEGNNTPQNKQEVFRKIEKSIELFNKNMAFIKSGKMKYDRTPEEMQKYAYANSIKEFNFSIDDIKHTLELRTQFLSKKDSDEVKLGTNLTLKADGEEFLAYKATSKLEEILISRSKIELDNREKTIELFKDLIEEDVQNIQNGDYIKNKKYYISNDGINSKPSDKEEMIIITNPWKILKNAQNEVGEDGELKNLEKKITENIYKTIEDDYLSECPF